MLDLQGPEVNKIGPALQDPRVVGLVPLCEGTCALLCEEFSYLICASGEPNALCEKIEHNPSGLKVLKHVSLDSCIDRIFLIIKSS